MSKRSRKRRAKARAGSRMEPESTAHRRAMVTDCRFISPTNRLPRREAARDAQHASASKEFCGCLRHWSAVERSARALSRRRRRAGVASKPGPRPALWKVAWARLLRKLDRRGRIHWEEAMADGTFSSAKKGARA